MSGFIPGPGGGTPATYTYRTAGDELVCPICAPLNGNVYNVDDPDVPYPPLHTHCRCYLEYDEGEPADSDDYEDDPGGGGGSSTNQNDLHGGPGTDVQSNTPTLDSEPPGGVGPWEEDTHYFDDALEGFK